MISEHILFRILQLSDLVTILDFGSKITAKFHFIISIDDIKILTLYFSINPQLLSSVLQNLFFLKRSILFENNRAPLNIKTSEQALGVLREIIDSIKDLHKVTIFRRSYKDHAKVLEKLRKLIEIFKRSLSLIRKNYPIPEIIQNLVQILECDLEKTYITRSNQSVEVLVELDSSDWLSNKKINLKKIKVIEEDLLNVYHTPDK